MHMRRQAFALALRHRSVTARWASAVFNNLGQRPASARDAARRNAQRRKFFMRDTDARVEPAVSIESLCHCPPPRFSPQRVPESARICRAPSPSPACRWRHNKKPRRLEPLINFEIEIALHQAEISHIGDETEEIELNALAVMPEKITCGAGLARTSLWLLATSINRSRAVSGLAAGLTGTLI